MEQYTYMVEGHGSQERAGANPALGTWGRLAQRQSASLTSTKL